MHNDAIILKKKNDNDICSSTNNQKFAGQDDWPEFPNVNCTLSFRNLNTDRVLRKRELNIPFSKRRSWRGKS